MQPISALGKRLLEGTSTLPVSSGADLLDFSLKKIGTLDEDLLGGTITRSMLATVHSSTTLQITRRLNWGGVLVRPWMAVHDPTNIGSFQRWNVGTFVLTTPKRVTGAVPTTFDVTGYDRLYLLDRKVGDSYAVPKGARYLAAVQKAIADAGLTGVLLDTKDADKRLPEAMTWPLVQAPDGDVVVGSGSDTAADATPTTWLRIINDLLGALGYRGLWADENGYYRSEPYLLPAQRPAAWLFSVAGASVVLSEERTIVEDDWNRTNRWVFVRRGDPGSVPSPDNGIYVVTDTADVARRGLIWPEIVEVDAADQESLVRRGKRHVNANRGGTGLSVSTSPFPPMGHFDILRVIDPEVAGSAAEFRVQAHKWTLDLNGADMTHEWRVLRPDDD